MDSGRGGRGGVLQRRGGGAASRSGASFRRYGVGGGGALCPLWIRCVGGLRQVGWLCWLGWQVVRIQWCPRGLPWVRLALDGLAFSGVGMVALRLRFLGGGGQLFMVGWVVVLGARWVWRPSWVVMLPLHGGLSAGAVGWQVVVVVVGVMEVVAVVAVVVVVLVVVVLSWDMNSGHHFQPLGLQCLVDGWGGFGVGLNGDCRRGVPCPRVGLVGGGRGLWGPDGGVLEDRDLDDVLDGFVLRGRLRVGGARWG